MEEQLEKGVEMSKKLWMPEDKEREIRDIRENGNVAALKKARTQLEEVEAIPQQLAEYHANEQARRKQLREELAGKVKGKK
jgi:hypothetical protein